MTHLPPPPPDDGDLPTPLIEPSRYRAPASGVELPRPRIAWGSLLLSVVVLITAWAAWFVLTARSVGIATEPADAAVTVREWPVLRIADHWLLREGPRRVHVSAPGYVSFAGDIDVSEAHLQTHRVILQRLPGNLRVALTPAASAELLLDGKPFATVPGLVEAVPAGRHDIEVRAPRYLTFQTTLEIEGKGIEQALEVVLDPAWADVSVDSVPSAAKVRVDGELLGHTPITVELLDGRRVVELLAEGYKPWKQTVKITPGVAVNLGEVVLAKADGQLRVASRPDGANVTVDGEFRGRTPLAVALTPDRSHRVRVLKEGYAAVEQSLSIASGKSEALEVELVAELATIHFVTSPEDAELLIDGEARGSATQSLELPTHEHEITIRRRGYATYQTRITPRKGVEKRFKIRLKTQAETQAEAGAAAAPGGSDGAASKARESRAPIKGFLTTAAGQEMKLFNGGKAVLGAERRSPGYQANEVRREVLLARPFYLSIKEVSNAEYRLFLALHHSGSVGQQSIDDDSQPVTQVSWANAALYCNWLSRRDGLTPFYQIKYGEVLGVNPDSTGYRLPSEAEWEWAARAATLFAWGDKFPPTARAGNYADQSGGGDSGEAIKGYNDGFAAAAPIGSFTPNQKGLYDMDGNVAEWVHDFYDAAPASSPVRDPLGPASGPGHVIKGGSWALGSVSALRASFRTSGSEGRADVGFRLARYAQ